MAKKKINQQPRKRRTNDEICVDIRKERKKLYYLRSKAEKSLKSGKLTKKKKASLESKLRRSSTKINKINVRLVKCGVRWDNFKKNKGKIRREINKLKKEVRSGNLSDKDINKHIHDIRELSENIQLLEGKMYEQYLDDAILPKGETQFNVLDDGDLIEQYLVVWELKDKVSDAIATEKFDTINIDGDINSVIDLGAVMMDLDVFITDIADKQHLTATPMVILYFDFPNKEIKVVNNTSVV